MLLFLTLNYVVTCVVKFNNNNNNNNNNNKYTKVGYIKQIIYDFLFKLKNYCAEQNELNYNYIKKKRKPTTHTVPRRSPIQVLSTDPTLLNFGDRREPVLSAWYGRRQQTQHIFYF